MICGADFETAKESYLFENKKTPSIYIHDAFNDGLFDTYFLNSGVKSIWY